MDLAVIHECFIDTNLIETLVRPNGSGYNHQHGCATVAKKMKERFANDLALGIIDKDKNEIDYLKEFELIIQKGNLSLYKHTTRHHYIVQISPAIESFILENVKLAEINLQDFDLPSDFNAFKKSTKETRSKNDDKFKRLFKAINNAGSREFNLLASWIRHLKDNPYKVDFDYLKDL
jgi:hypothetical protein